MPDYRFGFNGMLRDDDVRDKNAPIQAEEGLGNSYSTEFRGYDPRRGQWLSIDPLAYKFPWSSPYVAMGNNPVIMVDPDGSSTVTTNSGNVLYVKDDKDLSVYKKDKDNLIGPVAPGFGLSKMGETQYWDEFVSPETGNTMTNYHIQFGESFDPIIHKMHQKAKDMDLIEIANKSKGKELFDIKKDYPNVGKLLSGKYATSRSAGNFLAGYNAESGRIWGFGISFDTFQKLAGALHIEESNGKHLSKIQMLEIFLLGTYKSSNISSFKSPTWGELMYQYRMSYDGWNYGSKK